MKLKDFQKKCPGVRLQLGELEIDATRLIEHSLFEREDCRNYRQETINYLVRHKIDGHSTCNNIHEFAKAFVKVQCPSCHKNMKIDGGSGNSHSHTVNYKCDCGTMFHLTTPNDGMSIEFKSEEN